MIGYYIAVALFVLIGLVAFNSTGYGPMFGGSGKPRHRWPRQKK